MVQITDAIIREFERDGAVCLRQVFGPKWIEKVASGVDRLLTNPSEWSENLLGVGGAGRYFNDYCQWKKISEFQDFVFNSGISELVGKILQSDYVSFYHEHVLIKEPGTNKKTPWHVDQTYYPVDGDKACSVWMPLDPVSASTTIEFIAGSHKNSVLYRPRKFATSQNYPVLIDEMDKKYTDVPDIEANKNKYNIIKWQVEPGDIIIFSMKCLHGAPENMLPISRRVFSTRWLGDDCVIARRPWETSPPTLGGLNIGDKAISEEFPKVWQRN